MDRKRKADGNQLCDIVVSEKDMSDNALDESMSSKMVVDDGTSSGQPSDGDISARRSKMFQDAGASACQNPAVTTLLSLAAENVNVASILLKVTKAKKRTLENKQLPEYRLGLDAVSLKELRALHVKGNEISEEYVAKRREAKMDYQQKINPLYQRRSEIVAGVTENDKGVPDFWLSALLGSTLLDNEITKEDEQPLKHLMNINYHETDAPERSLKLEFVFDSSNPFFENTVLTKVIYYKCVQGEYVVDTEGTRIDWKEGKCLNALYGQNGVKSFFDFFKSSDEHSDLTMKLHERIAKAIELTVLHHAYTLYLDTKASGKLGMDPSKDQDAGFK